MNALIKWLAPVLFSVLVLAAGCGSSGDGTIPGGGNDVPIALQRVFPDLPTFSNPVAMLQAPNDATRWFVVQQAGQVKVFANVSNVSTATDFIDISGRVDNGGEMGLLGMAFHPGFPGDPRVYLSYTFIDTTVTPSRIKSRISEFRTADGGLTLDPSTEAPILTVLQPPNETNHKGGNIAFGPGDFLFIGFGDGGGANDQHGSIGNAQDTFTLLGKMLRIDVSGTAGSFRYRIPLGNLVPGNMGGTNLCGDDGAGTATCPEIYATGFRNPWRWSFDRQTGELWVGDVGQGQREEVDRVTAGGNYGWRCFEGTRNTGLDCGSPANPLPPVAEYHRSDNVGGSITGGFVYRGTQIAELVGRYVFGDYLSGRIFSIPATSSPTVRVTGGLDSGLNISSFGQGVDGELYVVDYGGQLYKIIAP